MKPQDIPATCDGCVMKFLIEHALSFPKVGLVLAPYDNAAKEWGALGAAITYKPKINRRTVQGGRIGAGAQQEGGEADGDTDTI